jgi:hypothetical protein
MLLLLLWPTVTTIPDGDELIILHGNSYGANNVHLGWSSESSTPNCRSTSHWNHWIQWNRFGGPRQLCILLLITIGFQGSNNMQSHLRPPLHMYVTTSIPWRDENVQHYLPA